MTKRSGAANYSVREQQRLLDLVAKYLPANGHEWKLVASAYNTTKVSGWKCREPASLKRKLSSMSAGHGSNNNVKLQLAERARQAKANIKLRMRNTKNAPLRHAATHMQPFQRFNGCSAESRSSRDPDAIAHPAPDATANSVPVPALCDLSTPSSNASLLCSPTREIYTLEARHRAQEASGAHIDRDCSPSGPSRQVQATCGFVNVLRWLEQQQAASCQQEQYQGSCTIQLLDHLRLQYENDRHIARQCHEEVLARLMELKSMLEEHACLLNDPNRLQRSQQSSEL